MRISVDVEEVIVDEVVRLTGERNKSPALAYAISEFVRIQKVRDFGTKIRTGEFLFTAKRNPEIAPKPTRTQEITVEEVPDGFSGFHGVD